MQASIIASLNPSAANPVKTRILFVVDCVWPRFSFLFSPGPRARNQDFESSFTAVHGMNTAHITALQLLGIEIFGPNHQIRPLEARTIPHHVSPL
jgi:hypothetical protein